MRSFSRDEVRAADQYAIETLGIPGVILMENAGRNTSDVADEMLEGAKGKSVAIVAGAGNNGGDGFVIARHLSRRGANVKIFLVAPREKITGDAETNLRAAESLEIDFHPCTEDDQVAQLSGALKSFDLIVDAVGGTGIKGALRGSLAEVAKQINNAGVDVLSVDIPTGLDCDTGQAQGPTVKAKTTVTFLARKKGFDAETAREYTGDVHVADIGIPAEWIAKRAGIDIGQA